MAMQFLPRRGSSKVYDILDSPRGRPVGEIRKVSRPYWGDWEVEFPGEYPTTHKTLIDAMRHAETQPHKARVERKRARRDLGDERGLTLNRFGKQIEKPERGPGQQHPGDLQDIGKKLLQQDAERREAVRRNAELIQQDAERREAVRRRNAELIQQDAERREAVRRRNAKRKSRSRSTDRAFNARLGI